MSRSDDMRHILDQIQQCSVNEYDHRMPVQSSTYDQVADLVQIANNHGLYDAADWLKMQLQNWTLK